MKGSVSIPNRDFDELQWRDQLMLVPSPRFQSLIGILMNCNVFNILGIYNYQVSIPNRDFDELQSATS